MERTDELKEIDAKNRTCYYSNDIIAVMDRDGGFDFSDILLEEKHIKKFAKIF